MSNIYSNDRLRKFIASRNGVARPELRRKNRRLQRAAVKTILWLGATLPFSQTFLLPSAPWIPRTLRGDVRPSIFCKVFTDKNGELKVTTKSDVVVQMPMSKTTNSMGQSQVPSQSKRRRKGGKKPNRKSQLQQLHYLKDQLHRAFDSFHYGYQDAVAATSASEQGPCATFLAVESISHYYKAILRKSLDSLQQSSKPRSSQSGYRGDITKGGSPNSRGRDILLFLDEIQVNQLIDDSSFETNPELKGRVAALLAAILRIEVENEGYGGSDDDNHNEVIDRVWELCQSILHDMAQNGDVPSKPLISSLAMTLREDYRQNGNISDGATRLLVMLESVGDALCHDADNDNHQESMRACGIVWNMYLGSLCDQALETRNPSDRNLMKAAQLLVEPSIEKLYLNITLPVFQPDVVSFNTVLDAAAKVKNESMVNLLWDYMKNSDDVALQPNARSYNARISSLQDSTKQLDIFDNELMPLIKKAKDAFGEGVVDSRTIDLFLAPLVRAGRDSDLHSLIERWVASTANMKDYKQRKMLQEKFSAFLYSAGKLNDNGFFARDLFSRYMIVNTTVLDSHDESLRLVLPERRHFNLLLDTYADIAVEALEMIQKHLAILNPSNSFDDSEMNGDPKYVSKLESSRSKAVRDAWELYHVIIRLNAEEPSRHIFPDDYTLSTMVRCCDSSDQVSELLDSKAPEYPSPIVVRSSIGMCGLLGDPSASCMFFEKYRRTDTSPFTNTRQCNALLGALADGARLGNVPLDGTRGNIDGSATFLSYIHGLSCTDAVLYVLRSMHYKDSMTYCNVASALQYADASLLENGRFGMELFRNATEEKVPADGRMLNAIIRCFGDDIKTALEKWKTELRPACLAYEHQANGKSQKKNLLAAYEGLVYVCGRAERADVAVRICYAMRKEGIEPLERTFNSYISGKRTRQLLAKQNASQSKRSRVLSKLLPKIRMNKQYEDLLYVECKEYDIRDRRTEQDRRIRIIV